DPIEVEALGAVVANDRPPGRPLVIGSVKTNIGHGQAAAGVAGVIKVLLQMRHERIARSLHAERLNPRIARGRWPPQVATRAIAWPRGERPGLAGVSGFGISGTTAHVVLEEPPLPAARKSSAGRGAELAVLSGKGPDAVKDAASRLADR